MFQSELKLNIFMHIFLFMIEKKSTNCEIYMSGNFLIQKFTNFSKPLPSLNKNISLHVVVMICIAQIM